MQCSFHSQIHMSIHYSHTHPQELEQMKSRIAKDEVNVEVDSASGPELGTILSELRSQYEGIVKKNKDQAEQWYRKKVRAESAQLIY